MGVYLIQTPSGFLINVLSQTLLPAFSHVQSDNERANRILREVTSWLILLGLPAVAAIWLCGPSLLAITYGPRYAAAAGALAIAAGVAFLNTLNSMITNLFYAAGKPALHLRAVAVSAVVMMILVYPACRYLGLAGGQVAAIIAITASYFLQVARARDLTGLRLLQYGRSFGPAIAVSAGIIVAGIGARWIGVAITPVANIAFATAVCVMAYVLFVPAFVRIRQ
jgi:O-antigen/teichoic acid export membrane protein